jgi:hypothetical protein
MSQTPAILKLLLVALGLGLAFFWGCERNRSPSPPAGQTVASQRAAVRLTVLVVDDPELAAGVSLLRGEWAERSGGELVVQEMTLDELLDAEQLTADLIIYPSRHVGTLVSRDWLRPVRDSVLQDDEFSFDDLLPLVRNEVMRYGGQVVAVSLGESPLVLAWRGDVESVPHTWQRLDKQLPPQTNDSEWVVELIARAACYADPRYRAELLFDSETMAPRLTSPVMVRTLEEIVARTGGTDDALPRSRITWPTARDLQAGEPWHFAALPQSDTVFDVLRERWEPESLEQAPTVLGFAGRSASVTASSRNATSSFKLLGWLTRGEIAARLSSRSQATVWFRNSQSSRAERWLDGRGSDDVATLVPRLLSSGDCFLLPRVPGIDRYLAALNHAVGQAVRGELSPTEALDSATDKWERLTDGLGKDAQLQAYHRHLGLVETGP